MTPKKRNNKLTFICSLFPGAAEMYMGFMKSGLSLLVLFFMPIFAMIIFNIGDFLAILSIIVYVFAFFHARNIANAPEDEFELLEDRYVWEEFTGGKEINIPSEVYRKWVSAALILAGLSGIWYACSDILYTVWDCFMLTDYEIMFTDTIICEVPRVAFSIFVVILAAVMLRKRKKAIEEDEE